MSHSRHRDTPRGRRLRWAVYWLLPAIKLWLVRDQLLAAIATARIDDRLFLDLARHLLAGDWLGPYDQYTLIKGPFHSMWIAATYVAGIPLLLSQHLLYLAACGLLVVALRPLVGSPWLRAALFAVLAFNPMTYTSTVAMRVVREGTYPALGLLVTACAAALLGRAERPPGRLLPWALGLGLALGAFWLNREEGLWILPLVVPALAVAAFRSLRPADGPPPPDRWRRLAVVAGLPALLPVAACLAVAAANHARYGVFTLVEIKSRSFTAAYGALTRVRGEEWHPLVPVSKEVREKIYPLSPALAELRPHLEGAVGQRWVQTTCRAWKLCDEIAGGWFQWALREAADRAGHHRSATAACDYYLRLAAEVNGACDDGALDCRGELASLRPRWDRRYLGPVAKAFVTGAAFQARFGHFEVHQLESKGDPESLRLFAETTGERVATEAEDRLRRVRGWAYSPRGVVGVQVLHPDGRQAYRNFRSAASPEIDAALRAGGLELPDGGATRFSVAHSCRRSCRLRLVVRGETLAELPLAGAASIRRPDLLFELEPPAPKPRPPLGLRLLRARILAAIAAPYRRLGPAVAVLALAGFAWRAVAGLRRRELGAVLVLQAGLLAAVVLRLALLAALQASTVPAFTSRYLCPSHPQLLVFAVLGVAQLAHELRPAAGSRSSPEEPMKGPS